MFSALHGYLAESGRSLEGLRSDALAGITVGVIALPLSMALAIAAGVPPQHGLYTAIVGGILIVCGLSPRILQKLERTTVREADGVLAFAGDIDAAVGVASGYSPRMANGTA